MTYNFVPGGGAVNKDDIVDAVRELINGLRSTLENTAADTVSAILAGQMILREKNTSLNAPKTVPYKKDSGTYIERDSGRLFLVLNTFLEVHVFFDKPASDSVPTAMAHEDQWSDLSCTLPHWARTVGKSHAPQGVTVSERQ